MRFKPGVVGAVGPYQLHEALARCLPTMDAAHRRVVKREGFITSLMDGTHSARSLHYSGRAVDFRTRDLSALEVAHLAAALKSDLGPAFDVVVEETHIHVEWDPK